MTIIIRRPWTQQPPAGVRLARNELTKAIRWCLPLNGSPQEIVNGGRLTLGSAGSFGADVRGRHFRSAGSAAAASIPINLSAYGALTLSFWMYWDAYANNDALALEYGTNFVTDNGFIVDPNTGVPATGTFTIGVGAPGFSNVYSFARPTAASWLHYMVEFNRYANPSNRVWVNGTPQSLAMVTNNAINSLFGNQTLFLFSRAGASLFGAGRMQNLVLRPGVLANDALARDEFLNPWALFAPRQIIIPTAAAGATAPTISALSAINITATSAQPRITYTF